MTSVVPHATAPLSGSALQQLRRHIAKQRRQSSRFAQQRAAQRVLAQFRFFLIELVSLLCVQAFT